MSEAQQPCLIGVDGGGTACRVGLLYAGRRFEVEADSANVATDRAAAIATIRQGLEDVAAKAGLSMAALRACSAYLGLAGVMAAEDAAEVAAALPLERVRVEDDRRSAVVGALGDRDGAVTGIGTGSFLARRSGSEIRLLGGWGFVLGDEASGAWLGRGLLATALQVLDGLTERSPLVDAVLAEHGNESARIVAFGFSAVPGDFARLAPRVVAAAAEGDGVATGLMQGGAAYIERSLAALGWRAGEPLCLVGGVAGQYRPYLAEAVARSIVPPEGSALDGALHLASELHGSGGAA